MATALKKKQDWLVDNGYPKSYAYFMTGPNVAEAGIDLDIDKLVSGGYSQMEINQIIGSTENAYTAHKGKSGSKTAAAPKNGAMINGVGASCAKSAAKSVTTFVTKAKNVFATFTSSPHGVTKIVNGTIDADVLKAVDSIQGEVKILFNEAVEQLGEAADEVAALGQLDSLLTNVKIVGQASQASVKVITAGVDNELIEMVDQLKAIRARRSAFIDKKFFKPEKMKLLYPEDATDAQGLAWFDQIFDALETRLAKASDEAIGFTVDQILNDIDYNKLTGGLTDDLIEAFGLTGTDTPSTTMSKVIDFITTKGATDFTVDANAVVLAIDNVSNVAETLTKWITLHSAESVQSAKSMFGPIADAIDEASEALRQKFLSEAIAGSYQDKEFWLSGEPSILEQWAQKFLEIDNVKAAIGGQTEIFNEAVDRLSSAGFLTEGQLTTILEVVEENKLKAFSVVDEAIAEIAEDLPGFTATPESVMAKLKDPGYVDSVKAATTDELNPMVQTALEELGEPPSLTYFMNKKQKVDFLTNPDFGGIDYSIKYKGETLTGKGLDTAKQKYAQKTGQTLETVNKAANKTPEAALGGTTVDPIHKMPNLLPSAPKWYADPPSPAQENFLGKMINSAPDFVGEKLAGTGPNKGQTSAIIDLLKFQDNYTDEQIAGILDQILKADTFDDYDAYYQAWLKQEAAEIKTAKVIATGHDEINTVEEAVTKLKGLDPIGDTAEDVITVAGEADLGPTVSGQAQKQATSAAPKNPVWDEPHTFTYKGDASHMGGAHRKWLFEDENGDQWMLKNAEGFRADGEVAAHKIAHMAGFDIAEARVSNQSVGGSRVRGFMQRLFRKSDIEGELADVAPRSFASLDAKITKQIQEHQVLDWMLGNHDSHHNNFLILNDGRVVGIDKGQAFKFFGKDQLAHDYRPPGNPQRLAYETLWDDYRAGRIDLNLDAIDDALARIEAIDDDVLRDILRPYAEGRFGAPAGQAFKQGLEAASAEDLIDQIIARKNTIRAQFEDFYQEQARVRGVSWTPSWKKAAPKPVKKIGDLKAGDILTPITDDFAQAMRNAGAGGKALYVGGADVERGQVLYDLVRTPDGQHRIRVNLKLREAAQDKVERLMAAEAGESVVTRSAGTGPSLPSAITDAQAYHTNSVNAAKTVNHHISSADFKFNESTLASAEQTVSTGKSTITNFEKKAFTAVDDVEDGLIESLITKHGDNEAALLAELSEEIAEKTRVKAAQTFIPHLEAAVEQGKLGTAAQKVDLVPEFNAVKHYEDLLSKGKKKIEALADTGKVVDIDEPPKVFKSFTRSINGDLQVNFRTRTINVDARDPNPIPLEGNLQKINGIQRTQVEAVIELPNGVEAQVYYRGSNHHVNQKGWMEIEFLAKDGEVSASDIEAAHKWLSTKLGIEADLATAVDMELTYWRTVHGSYRLRSQTGSYANATQLADQRLSQLGPAATKAEEIEAIKGAYRQVFGDVIDDADFLPQHGRIMNSSLEEVGFGTFERPELTADELEKAMRGVSIQHSVSYGGNGISEQNLSQATGHAWVGQQEKTRLGFGTGAASAARDVEVGGSDALFSKMHNDHSLWRSGDVIVINPGRRARYLGDYQSDGDAFGALNVRSTQSGLSPQEIARKAGRGGNQYMLRDHVTLSDDVEMIFFSQSTMRDRFVREYTNRFGPTWRGVPWEERFVVRGRNDGQRLQNFFRKNVYGNLGSRMRREATEYVTGKVKAGAARIREDIQRLSIKRNRLTRKLSKGRDTRIWATVKNGRAQGQDGYTGLFVRYHVSENAISVPTELIQNYELFDNSLTKSFAQSEIIGPAGEPINASVFDLSIFNIDIRDMGKYERDQFFQEFIEAMSNSQVEDMVAKYGGILP